MSNYQGLKTNSKIVRECVKNYLIDSLEGTDFHSIKDVYNDVKRVKEYDIKRNYGIVSVNIVVDYLQGLPLHVAYSNADIIVTLSKWLESPLEEQEKYFAKKGDYLYWYLLAREVIKEGCK